MSHPIPGHHYGENEEGHSKSHTIKAKVKKFKYGMNKPGNNVDKLLSALKNKQK